MTQSLDPRLRHAFWFVAELFAAVASALALLLIILRLAMPHADAFKPQLEAWASEAFGETVRIGTVEGHWPGLDLTVVLGDVEMLAPDGSVRTRFDRAYVGLDPLASLFKGTLAVRELHLDGLELTLFGDVLVDAAANASPDPALRPAARADFGWFLPWLFSQRQVDVTSGRLHWPGDPAAAPPFDLFSLRTRSDGDHHELAIRLEALSGSASVDLAAGIDGEARVRESWNGQVYLRGNRVRWETVAALLDRLAPGSTGELLSIDGTLGLPEQADFELWADARDGHLARVLGEGALSDPPGRALLGIARVATRFDWRPDGPGWDLAIDGVEVEPVGGRRYRTGPARVRYAASPGRPAQVEAALASVDLAILHRVAGAGKWLDEAQVARLDGFAPRGQLYDLRGRWTAGDGDVPARWRVVGEAWDLAVAPWRKWPGVEGLRVAFDVGPDGGHGTLFGRDGSLQLPWLFREPLALERVDGTVRVSRDARGWSLRSDDLEVANRHVQTRSRLEATLPADGGAPFLDLEVGYRDGDAGEAWRYLPAGIMPGPVVDWVDRGIVSGRVVEGGMVLRGPLDRFPFDGHEGRFQVRFLVEDVTLDYLEGWPPIEGLDAWVEFAGRGMRIEARDGRILGATLGPTVADTPDLTAKPTPRLRIDGRVTGDADDGLRYLRESPLQSRFGDYLEVARGRGRIDLDLALAVALKGGTTDVDGTLRLDGVTLDLPTYGIVVERGRGTLTFDNDSLAGNGLQAEWRGMPVGIDVQVPDDAEAGRGGPRITARGRAGQAQFAPLLPPPLADRLVGELPWTLVVGVHESAAGRVDEVRITGSSDLVGLAVALPEPLGKPAGASEPLRIEAVVPAAARPGLRVAYGPLDLVAELERRDGAIAVPRAALAVGAGRAELPATPVWTVELQDEQPHLEAWLDVLDQSADIGTPAGAEPPLRVDARFARVPLGDALTLNDLEASAVREPDAWRVTLTSRETAGELRVPRGLGRGTPVRADLARISLAYRLDPDDAPFTEPAMPEAAPDPASPDPRTLPGLRLSVATLEVNGHDLGRLELVAEPTPDGLRVPRLALESPDWNLAGQGRWGMAQDGIVTEVDLKLDTTDFNRLSTALFGTGSELDVEETHYEASLHWPGAPHHLTLARLDGTLEGRMIDGVLTEIDPGVGRLFSLVNLGTLGRRLSLDFSDLLGKGTRFDAISGSFLFENGDAFTNDTLIEAPAATVSLMGRTGLVARDYDQVMTVMPHVSGTLPIAGTVLGGPVVGAALLLFNEVFSEQVDRLSRVQYRITGPWEAPRVERIERAEAAAEDNLPLGGESR